MTVELNFLGKLGMIILPLSVLFAMINAIAYVVGPEDLHGMYAALIVAGEIGVIIGVGLAFIGALVK